MFIKFIEDFKSDEVIASKVNPFENETIMHSFHVVGGQRMEVFDGQSFNIEQRFYIVPDCLPPIDVLYKSKQTGEQLYFVLSSKQYIGGGTLTINLNGSSNIILNCEYNTEFDNSEKIQYKQEDCDYGSDNYRHNQELEHREWFLQEKTNNEYLWMNHYYFPISKKDFLKCCQASTMAIQVKNFDNSFSKIYESGSWNEQLLPIFRNLYNKTIDNNMFVEAENEVVALYQLCDAHEQANKEAQEEYNKERERRNKEDDRKEILIWILIILLKSKKW